MHVQDLDVTDPAALEAALDAAPLDTLARVETAGGETLTVVRVPGGWHLPGDLTVTSGDVAEGGPRAVSLLLDQDYRSSGWSTGPSVEVGDDLFGEDPYGAEDGL